MCQMQNGQNAYFNAKDLHMSDHDILRYKQMSIELEQIKMYILSAVA